ncbi:unnamed protein product [Lactuca saligna]|uniref:Uncharacterized protein n=1 Tax=Lactuca saligna TaxID=75948 RepID=A0AA35ZUD1_LACSI|nr:unnamed protein product [Lactuca saligna]
MLRKVDSSNLVLQAYLKTINPSVETRILSSRIKEGPSKRLKKIEESPTKLIEEKKKTKSPTKKPTNDVNVSKPKDTTGATKPGEPLKEVVPSKTGLKKIGSTSNNISSDTSNVKIIIVSSLVSQPEPIIVFLPLKTNVATTLLQGTPIIVSSTFETSTIDTTTTLPPFVTALLDTHSPTFDNILNQPITSLFSSQSTDPPVTTTEVHHSSNDDENVVDGTFGDIHFDPEEEEIPDNMILTGKQFKILNQKLNSLLQIQADGGGKHSELPEDMSKDIEVAQKDYASINQKMDIIVDAVTKFVKIYEVLGPKVDQMSKDEVQSFSEIKKLLTELKEIVSKPGSSPLITP